MRYFKLGDKIHTDDWGEGVIVAMSKQWCIMKDIDGYESAALWVDGVYLKEAISPPEVPVSSICRKKIKESDNGMGELDKYNREGENIIVEEKDLKINSESNKYDHEKYAPWVHIPLQVRQ